MNAAAGPDVKPFVILRVLAAAAAVCAAFGADQKSVLERVEDRYNKAKTLKLSFSETYTVGGRARKMESGELYLRKPGKMRWNYADPLGKLFLSDGKSLYLYTPNGNRAEKMRLRETDDLRAPLAFLLGKLDFERDFRNFTMKHEGSETHFTAEPRSEKLPYRKVDFTIGLDYEIKRLSVLGHDNSVLAFTFANEVVNPPIDNKMFEFRLPPGATFVDTAEPQSSGK